MGKMHVNISIDPELIKIARNLNLNLSELAQDAIQRAVNVTLEVMKQNSESIEEVLKEKEESAWIIKQESEKIRVEQLRALTEMRHHVKAAKEAGVPRCQAETDFGHVFPDSIWGE
jgi:ElaB/YqjD/DUF883 family membrane-anchored ribosome-binding protein